MEQLTEIIISREEIENLLQACVGTKFERCIIDGAGKARLYFKKKVEIDIEMVKKRLQLGEGG